ncbi:GH25 family lysozyme [Pseudarthrobacter sp. Y6]|uniref:GH25 family lysozyme n=1 Tax=Pseudarthrobacter sp. Y6 TaxID=3418422 RepID=UPI003CEDFF29
MSLSKVTSARAGAATSFGVRVLAAALLTSALVCSSFVPAVPASAAEQVTPSPSSTPTPATVSTAAPTTDTATEGPTASAPASSSGEATAASPAPIPTEAVPPGSTVDAETQSKLKAAQGVDGAHMGQGLQQKLGMRATSEAAVASTQATYMPPGIQGLDVSSHQGDVNWQQQRNMGGLFAYVKATEALNYQNPYFSSQYNGSRSVGMIRGAYHFAIPNVSSGASQANYFASNGGAWSGDGTTLPPLLDIEYNPYPELGNTCYNLSQSQMVLWIADFSNTMYTRTGRYPAIYTTTDWWTQCTGNSPAFRNQPLHIASYRADSPGTLPAGWSKYAIWQYSSQGPFVGDSNVFSGSYAELQALATGYDPVLNKYAAMGGVSSRLGAQTLPLYCGLLGGGCYRQYVGGQIIWHANTGAQAVYFSSIGATWRSSGGVDGRLGYPTSDETCSASACLQNFQGGSIYWSTSTPAVSVFQGGIGQRWLAMGGTASSLGYPTVAESCSAIACSQPFQGGRIVWTADTGAWALTKSAIASKWTSLGAETGKLAYPVDNESCNSVTCIQNFQGGSLTWSSAAGPVPVWNTLIGWKWRSQGGLSGLLGAALSAETCGAVSCLQAFTSGEVFWAPDTGAQILASGEISKKWKASQSDSGRFGAPTGDTAFCNDKECFQEFTGGKILKDPVAAGPAFGVLWRTGIGSLWHGMGGQQARLSYPTADETCQGSTCLQSFNGGTIYWTLETGQWAVYNGSIGNLWKALGGAGGRLGYPTSNETCGVDSCRQNFRGGDILWSYATGAVAVYKGSIGLLWSSMGAESGRLGFPTSSETCAATSCTQGFVGGEILWASGVGMGAVYNSGIGGIWRSNGAQQGFFGFPTSTETCITNECMQYFKGGSIRWSATAGYTTTRY